MTAFRDAVSLLTLLPVNGSRCPLKDPKHWTRALAWFPVVGALLGAIGGGVVSSVLSWWPASVSALLGLGFYILLTGGLHWDGFCDTVDGLASWKSPEETLRIMRDSRIGALGACAGFLLLLLNGSLIESLVGSQLLHAWAAAGAISRWSLVWTSQTVRYLPGQQGLGRIVTDLKAPASLAAATAVAVGLALAALGPWKGMVSMATAGVAVWACNRLFLRRLGGITGDTMGAVCVVAETLVLLVAAGNP